MRLCSIFNYFQIVFSSNIRNTVHVGRLSIQVNGYDCAGIGCYCLLDLFGANIVCASIRLNRNGRCTDNRNSQPGSYKCMCWYNDLISQANSIATQNQMQGIQAIAHSYAVFRFTIVGKLLLKSLNFLPQYITAGMHHTPISVIKLDLQFLIGGF